ncbi:sodium-dependent transporter [Spirochaetia bacterium]|nr:sodium-dependent transporter [Spirochaetia bacterium]
MNHHHHKEREKFSSQFGQIMAMVGSAVGLGNIWRFSYILGINGGGAFLLIYILCVVLVGIPVLISELSVGRSSALSSFNAYKKLAPGSAWILPGALGVLGATVILGYYPVVAGWALGYVFESLFNWNAVTTNTELAFTVFSSGWKAWTFAAIALLATVLVLLRGVTAGIEKSNKILMPLLGLILIVLVVRSLTLPGAVKGVEFLFVPDFSRLGINGILDALGHSFYSLSLGMGIMITYASYMKKESNLAEATVVIVTMDTLIALLAGLAIFPAVFALGLNPGQGAGLAFVTLPGAFAQMPGGRFFSALFFLLLFIAALTSIMSLMQVPIAFLEDEWKMSKRRALLIVCVLLFIIGTPAVLSFGPLADRLIFGFTYFDLLDKFANNILLPVTAFLGALFIIFRFGLAASTEEFLTDAKNQRSILGRLYPFAEKYIVPIAIALILLHATGLFS